MHAVVGPGATASALKPPVHPAGCSTSQCGAQPGMAIGFWFPFGKLKLIETGDYSPYSVHWLEHLVMTWAQVLHRKYVFHLASQQEDHSGYARFMVLFLEALKLFRGVWSAVFLPTRCHVLRPLSRKQRSDEGILLTASKRSQLPGGNWGWATQRCYSRHLTHKWIKNQ